MGGYDHFKKRKKKTICQNKIKDYPVPTLKHTVKCAPVI